MNHESRIKNKELRIKDIKEKKSFLASCFLILTSNTGFTLIELIMVVAIIAIVGATTIPVGSRFLVQNHLKNKTNELVASLRSAQINSISGKGTNSWGVKTTSSQIILFIGNSYTGRNPAFDQVFSIPSSITITPTEIVFNKLTGNPNSAASITVSSSIGNNTITVNEVGTVNVN